MRRLLDAWWDVLCDPAATNGREGRDLVSAILFTLGTLALALGVAAIIGGSHG